MRTVLRQTKIERTNAEEMWEDLTEFLIIRMSSADELGRKGTSFIRYLQCKTHCEAPKSRLLPNSKPRAFKKLKTLSTILHLTATTKIRGWLSETIFSAFPLQAPRTRSLEKKWLIIIHIQTLQAQILCTHHTTKASMNPLRVHIKILQLLEFYMSLNRTVDVKSNDHPLNILVYL